MEIILLLFFPSFFFKSIIFIKLIKFITHM